MLPLKSHLDSLEARLQALIEGSTARLLGRGRVDLAARLVAAMKAAIQTATDGALLAPDLFTLQVHPSDVQLLRDNLPLLEQLAFTIQVNGKEMGLRFVKAPTIKVVADPQAVPGGMHILAQTSLERVRDTSTLVFENAPAAESLPVRQMYPLSRPVINIGRRVDNHLVLDDPRISRSHAQLRAVRGRYVIFDLDSAGGVFVNSKRVRQRTLYPGDVITLGGVSLIYGQDLGHEDSAGATHPIEL
jgi:hypothetical protein